MPNLALVVRRCALIQKVSFGRIAFRTNGLIRSTRLGNQAYYSSDSSSSPESKMKGILVEELGAAHVEVEDISGGCGSMYKMFIVSEEFEGLNSVKQHRLVQRALAKEIESMHGLVLKTMPVSKYDASNM